MYQNNFCRRSLTHTMLIFFDGLRHRCALVKDFAFQRKAVTTTWYLPATMHSLNGLTPSRFVVIHSSWFSKKLMCTLARNACLTPDASYILYFIFIGSVQKMSKLGQEYGRGSMFSNSSETIDMAMNDFHVAM